MLCPKDAPLRNESERCFGILQCVFSKTDFLTITFIILILSLHSAKDTIESMVVMSYMGKEGLSMLSAATLVFQTTELMVQILSHLQGQELQNVAAAHSRLAGIVAERVYKVRNITLEQALELDRTSVSFHDRSNLPNKR